MAAANHDNDGEKLSVCGIVTQLREVVENGYRRMPRLLFYVCHLSVTTLVTVCVCHCCGHHCLPCGRHCRGLWRHCFWPSLSTVWPHCHGLWPSWFVSIIAVAVVVCGRHCLWPSVYRLVLSICRSKIQKLQSLFSPKSYATAIDRSKMPPPQSSVVKRTALRQPPTSNVCLSSTVSVSEFSPQ